MRWEEMNSQVVLRGPPGQSRPGAGWPPGRRATTAGRWRNRSPRMAARAPRAGRSGGARTWKGNRADRPRAVSPTRHRVARGDGKVWERAGPLKRKPVGAGPPLTPRAPGKPTMPGTGPTEAPPVAAPGRLRREGVARLTAASIQAVVAVAADTAAAPRQCRARRVAVGTEELGLNTSSPRPSGTGREVREASTLGGLPGGGGGRLRSLSPPESSHGGP